MYTYRLVLLPSSMYIDGYSESFNLLAETHWVYMGHKM